MPTKAKKLSKLEQFEQHPDVIRQCREVAEMIRKGATTAQVKAKFRKSNQWFSRRRHQAWRMGLLPKPGMFGTPIALRCQSPDAPTPMGMDLGEDRKTVKALLDSAAARKLQREYVAAIAHADLSESIKDAWVQVLSEVPPIIYTGTNFDLAKGKSEEDAVLIISDSHIGQNVKPEQTQGLGFYSPQDTLYRAAHLERKVISILKNHVSSNIKTLHVIFLGDIVHGMLGHGAEATDTIPVATQCRLATWLFVQFLINISRYVQVEAYGAAVGNHGRWPNQHKMPTKNRFSNYDGIVYGSIEAALAVAGNHRVTWHMDEQIRTLISIRGVIFSARHGDHLKGGDKQLGIPAHGMAREVMSNSILNTMAKRPPVDYYLVGDKHKRVEIPTGNGSYIINGAWAGVDEYAFAESFIPQVPTQLLFGVHPVHKKTWQYDIRLDTAPPEHHYKLPFSL